MTAPRHIVAIVGGATAGAEAAGILAQRGVEVVVFEQGARPYGKIEDGLPRWHAKLRQKEYEAINERLDRPGVHFVPLTRIGRDVDFTALVNDWGFTAVILAHGAWSDRPLPIDGADDYVGRGLLYQNPFIYWFNHFEEASYQGPHYPIEDGAIVVGGGLASIDVVKVLQIEGVRRALAARGVVEDMLHIEHAGIPDVLTAHGLTWEALGLRGATLYYRRRIEDMPLAEIPEDADVARREKFEATRRRILEKAMQKYGFRVQPLRTPVGLLVEGNRLVGLRFQHTEVSGGQVRTVAGAFEEVRTPQVIASIGSIPEAMPGIESRGELYDFVDRDLGRLRGFDTVFSTGNVVTGKGNIAVSRRHSIQVTAHVVEQFLGLANGHDGEETMLSAAADESQRAASHVATVVAERPALAPAQAATLLQRVRDRQAAVGYGGNYRQWLARVTPPDLG